MTYPTFQQWQDGPPPAAFPVTQLVMNPVQKARLVVFTRIAVVIAFALSTASILTIQWKLGLLGHASPRLLALAALPGVVVVALLTAGIRRYNARSLRRRGESAQLFLSPEGVRVQSATFPLALPWPQVAYIQPQGASKCTVPALDPEGRQVLFVDMPAARLAEAMAVHSGGRTTPKVVQLGQAATSLRNIRDGYRGLGRRPGR